MIKLAVGIGRKDRYKVTGCHMLSFLKSHVESFWNVWLAKARQQSPAVIGLNTT